jgi:hypothetical protein
MKTTSFRLKATMILLAAAITITTNPAQAQRRTSSSENKREVRTENRRSSESSQRNNQKSASKENNEKKERVTPSQNNRNTDIVRQPRTVERGTLQKAPAQNNERREQTRPATRTESTNQRSVESDRITRIELAKLTEAMTTTGVAVSTITEEAIAIHHRKNTGAATIIGLNEKGLGTLTTGIRETMITGIVNGKTTVGMNVAGAIITMATNLIRLNTTNIITTIRNTGTSSADSWLNRKSLFTTTIRIIATMVISLLSAGVLAMF